MNKNTVDNKIKTRLFVCLALVLIALFLLSLRLGYQMIIKGEEYSILAVKQQTSDSVVSAVRGRIVDCNKNDLAISATTHTIWIRPADMCGVGADDKEREANTLLAIRQLADTLDMEEEDVEAVVRSESKLLKLKKYVEDDEVEAVRALKLSGIEITEDDKRYYPNGAFLSQVLGLTNDDGEGIGGLELYYNSVLSGLDGRWITNKDNKKNSLAYGVDKYYEAEDGSTLWLTIDQTVQKIITEKIAQAVIDCNADRAMCMIYDVKTGDILGMAQTEDYDPNYPRDPLLGDEEYFASLTPDQQAVYLNQMWRNFCVCDVYEPGSTFKLITTSLALEYGVTSMNDTFYCKPMEVADYTLKCWYYPLSHGQETLYEAVENSCNPAMITLSQRIGLDRYYAGLENFGLTEKTGVDFPGESSNILQGKNIVGLATMSYGQGIAVTPVSLVSAVGSIANKGYLMQPRFVKGLLDSEGNVIEEYEPKIKSRTISEQTAKDVLSIMEKVVSEGGGGKAKIPGYRIGGKTGTASKPIPGGYSETDVFGSFLGVAPIDDPQIAILVIVDTPRGILYGSNTAAPCAHDILEEVLPYLGIQPNYSDADYKAMNKGKVTVPNLTGKSGENAVGVLGGLGLEVQFSPELQEGVDAVIIDQFPKAGTSVSTGSYVTLYYEGSAAAEETE